MVLETQVDNLRLEKEQDLLDDARRREGKQTMDMEIQKDLKRDIHQAWESNEEPNPWAKRPTISNLLINEDYDPKCKRDD